MNTNPTKDESKQGSIVRSAGVVSLATLMSRITGLFRDQAIAAMININLTDPFFLAFKIPNFLRAIFAEGALSSAYIPVFNESLIKEDTENSRKFFSTVFTIVIIFTGIITILGIIAAPWIIKIFAWGWRDIFPAKQVLAVSLLKIMFPYILLISIAALFMGTLNSLKHFFVPAFSPALLNISMISGVIIGLFLF